MSTLWPCLVLPFDVSGTGYAVDPATLVPMFQGIAEADAQAHWLFGNDNPTLADMLAGTMMTPRLGTLLQTGGSGYTTVPALARIGSGQTIPQTLSCALTGGAVSSFTETDPGSEDATAAGSVTVTGGGGAGAAFAATKAPDPTQQSGFLSLANAPASTVNGWQTPIEIKRDQTVCLVMKRKALAATTMCLGYWPPGSSRQPCWQVQIVAAGYTAYSRGGAGNFAGDGQIIAPPAGSVGDWLFLAVTHDAAGARRIDWGGGASYNQAGALDVSDLRHRIGIGGSVVSYSGGLDAAELIAFPAAKTAGQIAAIYARSKERLLARGITLL
ncbi:hypothetical protein NKH10_19545 [Mesorhizobium sp. M1340]|uniref:hypothetical protein n=1 Tax=Mesorhizobium sp. M1340 TaxID=2957087 RepID=UPI00333BD926